MKISYMIYCVLFLGATSAFMFFVESSVSGEASTHHGGSSETWTTSRKLKEMEYNGVTMENGKVSRDMHLYDYESMDPVPTGKASISSGAIVHGTPLMPHVSRPHPSSPPSSTPPPSSSWDD